MRLKSSIIKKETNYNKQKGLNFTNTMQPYNKNRDKVLTIPFPCNMSS